MIAAGAAMLTACSGNKQNERQFPPGHVEEDTTTIIVSEAPDTTSSAPAAADVPNKAPATKEQ